MFALVVTESIHHGRWDPLYIFDVDNDITLGVGLPHLYLPQGSPLHPRQNPNTKTQSISISSVQSVGTHVATV